MESNDDIEILHKQALDYYNAWLGDRARRHREYDERVAAYHASLAAPPVAKSE